MKVLKTNYINKDSKTNKDIKKNSNSTTKKFQEVLREYENYVEERIRNGPPKFQIGSENLTIEQWEKLILSIKKEKKEVEKQDLKGPVKD